jgi:hypothetical protein
MDNQDAWDGGLWQSLYLNGGICFFQNECHGDEM